MTASAAPETALHPWNQSFEWQESRRPLRRLSEDQAGHFDEKGFVLLEDVFDADTLAEVIAAIDPWEQKVTEILRGRPDGRFDIADAEAITFSINLVLRSPPLLDFCVGGAFQEITHDLVGPDVRLYWEQAVYKKPEHSELFPWHQDNGYTYLHPQQYLTCWVALTDTDEMNGCPWVVPGIHRQGTLRHWRKDAGWCCLEDPPDALAVPARAGSIVVFSSLTPHATGPNRSDAVRKSYIVQFAPDGAVVRRETESRRVIEIPQDDAARQPLLLRAGRPVD
jgi:ectoine hydroxylase-related dioxygenase (phytanoyl-CoA dioxygenase family)